MLLTNDLVAYETVADFKGGKPTSAVDMVMNKCKIQKLETIKNSLNNVTFLKEKGNNILELQKILKQRLAGSKAFFSKFDLVNPFKLWVIYGRLILSRFLQGE